MLDSWKVPRKCIQLSALTVKMDTTVCTLNTKEGERKEKLCNLFINLCPDLLCLVFGFKMIAGREPNTVVAI